ncbi:MAG: LacI family DNA-binding transcriptional regulator [Candidatus Izemoplasmatales bacterium]|jgi:LacI family transcriptional regulator|nr:LacI family DNA-binding transcriptional regulator [Candidatus Izemoplasmatales bacterium]
MVTIKDISKKSGFSITTVSKALNDYSDISPKTKKLILGLANEMNYIPNSQARSLVTQKSYTIGIIFHENSGIGLQHPLFSKILESFKTEVERAGYDLLFLAHKTGGQMGSYLQHSIRKQVEGIFVLCADFYSEELFELYHSELPIVMIDFEQDRIPYVTSDNEEAVDIAVRYLYDHGHRKIANIHGGINTFIGGTRKKAFEDSVKNLGINLNLEYQVEGVDFSKDDGYQAMQKILKLKDQPTAIFCASDMMAVGAIQAIEAAGKKVPRDYSIIGFDGVEAGQIITPRLTTIKQDTETMGKIAATEILKMVSKNKRPTLGKRAVVSGFLIEGDTVRNIGDK